MDGSPSNGLSPDAPHSKRWGDVQSERFGDVHYYNYQGDCEDPALLPAAQFVSEFGWQSWPDFESLLPWTLPQDRSFDGRFAAFRCAAVQSVPLGTPLIQSAVGKSCLEGSKSLCNLCTNLQLVSQARPEQ